jgi:hypothetical protein
MKLFKMQKEVVEETLAIIKCANIRLVKIDRLSLKKKKKNVLLIK